MSLFNSFDKTRHLNELLEPLETQGSGVLTPAQRQALTLASLTGGVALTAAQLAVVAGVVPGTASASKAVVLDSSKNVSGLGTYTGNGFLAISPSVGIGYATGSGGAVTQATSKATGVSLNTLAGAITLNNAALAAGTIVSFVLTDTSIAATDVLVLNHISGGTIGSYTLNAQAAAGSATINVRNNTAGSLSEALVLQFAVVKAVNA